MHGRFQQDNEALRRDFPYQRALEGILSLPKADQLPLPKSWRMSESDLDDGVEAHSISLVSRVRQQSLAWCIGHTWANAMSRKHRQQDRLIRTTHTIGGLRRLRSTDCSQSAKDDAGIVRYVPGQLLGIGGYLVLHHLRQFWRMNSQVRSLNSFFAASGFPSHSA